MGLEKQIVFAQKLQQTYQDEKFLILFLHLAVPFGNIPCVEVDELEVNELGDKDPPFFLFLSFMFCFWFPPLFSKYVEGLSFCKSNIILLWESAKIHQVSKIRCPEGVLFCMVISLLGAIRKRTAVC